MLTLNFLADPERGKCFAGRSSCGGGGVSAFRKFALFFWVIHFLSKFCVQLYLPPGANNEWTAWRSLRVQVAKTGAIAKARFKSGNVDFILADFWDGFPNQLSGFAIQKK